MTSGAPDPTVDEQLDRFIAAWHAGEGPSLAAYVDAAPPAQRGELTELIAAFLELAPSVPLTADAAAAKAGDPLVARLTAIEADWWDARTQVDAASAEAARTWGARLRAVREAAGLSVSQLAAEFTSRFGLTGQDVGRAPTVFEELEAGALPSTGVAARAARAIEEILAATPGSLLVGAAPPLGAPVLRGDLPDSADDRQRLADLLRTVDEAVGDGEAPHETLAALLGA